jgi:GDP-L-fucose synthase
MNKTDKIYVAGHSGLVGSAIMRLLHLNGYSNIIVRTHKELDLVDQKAVYTFFENEKPDYVFFAAGKVGGIGANLTYPADFIYQNVMMGFNIVQASYKFSVKKLINLSAGAVYPRLAEQPIKEEAILTGPLEPSNEAYAIAKLSVIKLCSSYNKQYGTNFISVLPCNIYGLGDKYDIENSSVLPAMIRKFHEARETGRNEVVLMGDGSPCREFLYSEDLANMLIFLMENKNAIDLRNTVGDFISVGSGKDVTIKELAETVRTVVYKNEYHAGGNIPLDEICRIVWDTSKPNGMPRRLLDTSRLSALGCRATTELFEGIMKAYADFLGRRSNDNYPPAQTIIMEAISMISHYHREKDVVADILRRYEKINWKNENIVLCGFSPYAKRLVNSLKDDSEIKGKLNIVDIKTTPDNYCGFPIETFNEINKYDMEKSVFIICSIPYMRLFLNKLKQLGASKIITYHLINVSDDRYDYEFERLNLWRIKRRISHFIENKDYYIYLFENMGDDESKIILAKLILYIFTLDITYIDVKPIQPPYFDFDLLPPNTYKCFIDLGGYNGDTLRDFLSMNFNFDEYWYFEPDEDLVKEAKMISGDSRVRYNNLAVGSKSGKVLFSKTPDLSMYGFITGTGDTEVEMVTLDNFFSSQISPSRNITCIKMDVEGYEYDVLLGAKEIISVQHPVLIISIEHKIDDIKKLSEFVSSLYDKYIFYIRCGTDTLLSDLTMYAIPTLPLSDT